MVWPLVVGGAAFSVGGRAGDYLWTRGAEIVDRLRGNSGGTVVGGAAEEACACHAKGVAGVVDVGMSDEALIGKLEAEISALKAKVNQNLADGDMDHAKYDQHVIDSKRTEIRAAKQRIAARKAGDQAAADRAAADQRLRDTEQRAQEQIAALQAQNTAAAAAQAAQLKQMQAQSRRLRISIGKKETPAAPVANATSDVLGLLLAKMMAAPAAPPATIVYAMPAPAASPAPAATQAAAEDVMSDELDDMDPGMIADVLASQLAGADDDVGAIGDTEHMELMTEVAGVDDDDDDDLEGVDDDDDDLEGVDDDDDDLEGVDDDDDDLEGVDDDDDEVDVSGTGAPGCVTCKV